MLNGTKTNLTPPIYQDSFNRLSKLQPLEQSKIESKAKQTKKIKNKIKVHLKLTRKNF